MILEQTTERFRNLPRWQRIALGGTAALMTVILAKEGYDTVHDYRHPVIMTGVEHSDVGELKTMLEESGSSSYDADGTSDVADVALIEAIQDFQLAQDDLDDEDIGVIREDDATWELISEDEAVKTPEGLPTDCKNAEDAICIVKDADDKSAELYVMHEGEAKFSVDRTGIGKSSDPSDNGTFTVDPNRLYQSHVSDKHGSSMPYSIFYNGGEAIHFSRTLAMEGDDYPGSFGCITIGEIDDAEKLFTYTRQVVADGREMNVVVAEAS